MLPNLEIGQIVNTFGIKGMVRSEERRVGKECRG